MKNVTGTIFNIQRFSVNDGPGIRTTVFLKGCPLHCPWCHNPESIASEPEIILHAERCIRCGECFAACKNHAILQLDGSYTTLREHCMKCGDCVDVCVAEGRSMAGKEITTEAVLEEVKRDVVFFLQSGGGATFSGGEPLLQHEFLLSLLTACKRENIHTIVDTTGYTSPSVLKRVALLTDLFLYDIKTLDDTLHRRYTGVSNRQILKNLSLLVEWEKRIIVRVPVIPDFNDNEDSLRAIGDFINRLGTITELHLLPYHRSGMEKYHCLGLEYSMTSAVSPPHEKLDALVEAARRHVPVVVLGG